MIKFIGICMLVILATILVTMYAENVLAKIFKVKNKSRYDMFVRWFIVIEIIAMILLFYMFA